MIFNHIAHTASVYILDDESVSDMDNSGEDEESEPCEECGHGCNSCNCPE